MGRSNLHWQPQTQPLDLSAAFTHLERRKRTTRTPTILEAMHDPDLFGPWFEQRESWRAWEADEREVLTDRQL